jgi:hypothetical protein
MKFGRKMVLGAAALAVIALSLAIQLMAQGPPAVCYASCLQAYKNAVRQCGGDAACQAAARAAATACAQGCGGLPTP